MPFGFKPAKQETERSKQWRFISNPPVIVMQEPHITHITGWDFYTFMIAGPFLAMLIIYLGEKLIRYWETRRKRNIERDK